MHMTSASMRALDGARIDLMVVVVVEVDVPDTSESPDSHDGGDRRFGTFGPVGTVRQSGGRAARVGRADGEESQGVGHQLQRHPGHGTVVLVYQSAGAV